jgi:hypothetical protein
MDRWIQVIDILIACEIRNYKSYICLMACELSNYNSCISFMLNYELLATYYERFLYCEIFSQVPCSIMRFCQLTMKFLFN